VAVIGDGALTGGMAYEALNNLGHSGRRVVVVLNDNGRSYAPTVSHLSQSLTSLRLHPTYIQTRQRLRTMLRELPAVGELAYSGVHGVTSALRELVAPHTFFEALGVRYAGPIDGHDIPQLEQALRKRGRMGRTDRRPRPHPEGAGLRARRGGRGPAPPRREGHPDPVERQHRGQRRGLGHRLVRGHRYRRPRHRARRRGPRARPAGDLHRRLHQGVAARGRAAPRDRRSDRGDARADRSAPLRGPIPRAVLRRRDRGAARADRLRPAWPMGGLRPVVAVYSTFFSRAFDQANLDIGLHQLAGHPCLRPRRHHRRRRPEPSRPPRHGPVPEHPGHGGVRPLLGRGARGDGTDGPVARRARRHPLPEDAAAPRGPRRGRRRHVGQAAPFRRRLGLPDRYRQAARRLPRGCRRARSRRRRRHGVGPAGSSARRTPPCCETPSATGSWSPPRTASAWVGPACSSSMR